MSSWPLIKIYLVERLRERGTYLLTLIVGTLINLYGHVLVPALHGEPDPFANFIWKIIHDPVVMGVSIFLGYLFPFLVGLFSAVTTRVRGHRLLLLARLGQRRPGAMVLVDTQGHYCELGGESEAPLLEQGRSCVAELIGDKDWTLLKEKALAEGLASQSWSERATDRPRTLWLRYDPPHHFGLYLNESYEQGLKENAS